MECRPFDPQLTVKLNTEGAFSLILRAPIAILLSLKYAQGWGNGMHSDVEKINRTNVPTKYRRLCDIIKKDPLLKQCKN